jgi:hypothetical protein
MRFFLIKVLSGNMLFFAILGQGHVAYAINSDPGEIMGKLALSH